MMEERGQDFGQFIKRRRDCSKLTPPAVMVGIKGKTMREISRFKIAMIALGLGFGACTADEPIPGDEIAGQSETPEIEQLPPELSLESSDLDGTFQGNEFQLLACNVKLVYCRDPRWSPHYPSYCSNGCTVTQRRDAAYSLCRQVCGSINCSTQYYLGGC